MAAMAFWSKKVVDPAKDKIGYLTQFASADLEILTSPDGLAGTVPDSWLALGGMEREQRLASALQPWEAVVATQLSNTLAYLRDHLIDVELLRVGSAYFLLYSVTNLDGSPRYYVGGNPLRPDFGKNGALREQWPLVPASLRAFYEQVHDGFYEFSSRSSGPDGLAYVVHMTDLEWGIIDQLQLDLKIDLATSYAFFNNGGGGYVVLDLAQSETQSATLWWSDDAPRYDIDFWDLVDDWTVIGFSG
jgi:hypothetical protein